MGIIKSVKLIYKTEGFPGVFKGNLINCSILGPFSVLEFYCYELNKNNLYPGQRREEFSFPQKLICGGLAGTTAAAVVYPADVVKTFIILNREQAQKSAYRHAVTIYERNGIRGFYKGMIISSLGIAPFIGIRMSVFDMFYLNSRA